MLFFDGEAEGKLELKHYHLLSEAKLRKQKSENKLINNHGMADSGIFLYFIKTKGKLPLPLKLMYKNLENHKVKQCLRGWES
jgi:hypothetical protein